MAARFSLLVPICFALLVTTGRVQAQQPGDVGTSDQAERSFFLEPAYPNPFRQDTRIPFVLRPGALGGDGMVTVSMRVFNLLHQLIAVPALVSGPEGTGRPLDGLVLHRSGRFEARWDGKDGEGRRVASGPYFVQLVVGGDAEVKKLLVTR